eukprot:scaffold87792_cov38-Phaeocystis_antarctica.AAC.1
MLLAQGHPPFPPARRRRARAMHRGLAPRPRLCACSAPLEARDVLGAVALGDGDGDARELVLEQDLLALDQGLGGDVARLLQGDGRWRRGVMNRERRGGG